MFKRLFAAIANLTASMESLALSVTEANTNFRQNLGLDAQPVDQPAQLEHAGEAEAETNGPTKRKARRG
jgi:hypothetical protein